MFSSWNSEPWRCLDVLILLYHKPWRKYLEVIGILIIWRTCIACIINGTVFGSIQHIQFSLGIPKTRDVMSWTVSSTEFWSLRTWSMLLVGHGNLFETIFDKDPQSPSVFSPSPLDLTDFFREIDENSNFWNSTPFPKRFPSNGDGTIQGPGPSRSAVWI